MRGQIQIPAEIVDGNRMNWDIFDFFKAELKRFTHEITAGWYAYKLIDKVYYFYWCDKNDPPTNKYCIFLKKDGFELFRTC